MCSIPDLCGQCHDCLDLSQGQVERVFRGMILCPDCGNKRCPKATSHKLACTDSNEPGQKGSIYEVLPKGYPGK